MWKREEHRYTTIMAMAMYIKSGVWKLKDTGKEYTQEEIIQVFERAYALTLTKEASGNRGFSPNGSFSSIHLYEKENGRGFEVHSPDGGLRCVIDGLFHLHEGKVLCFDLYAQGLNAAYFRYMDHPTDDHVSMSDLLAGNVPDEPNVRRCYAMLYAHPFVYQAHLCDKDGIGLLDYDKEIRKATILAAEDLG